MGKWSNTIQWSAYVKKEKELMQLMLNDSGHDYRHACLVEHKTK